MAQARDEHDKLLYYGAILAVGIIAIVLGVQESSWETAIIGVLFAGFGGFEVNLTYRRIQIEDRTIRSSLRGHGNTQINQTNPQNSTTIGKIGTAIFTSGPSQEVTPKPKSSSISGEEIYEDEEIEIFPDSETLCGGQIHFEDFEEFDTNVSKGDKINIKISSAHPISAQIMNEEDYDSFDSDSKDNEVYWRSPNTTSYSHSWSAKKREHVYVLIVNETDLDEWDEEEAIAMVRIDVLRRIS